LSASPQLVPGVTDAGTRRGGEAWPIIKLKKVFRAYAALADPTRRRLLEALREGDARITGERHRQRRGRFSRRVPGRRRSVILSVVTEHRGQRRLL